MSILIDGYNLLHAVGIIPAGSEPSSLENARRELFAFLFRNLTADERRQTTVVFDARKAPPGLPHELSNRELRILFAHDHDEADDLIEQLIRADHVPRKLTVVSSDHRIQRAANRRRARPVDSDQWYWHMHERQHQAQPDEIVEEQEKPATRPGDEELEVWLSVFAGVAEIESDASSGRATNAPHPAADEVAGGNIDKPTDMENPFPPGYGEDLLDDSN